jgi:hypothetical protein
LIVKVPGEWERALIDACLDPIDKAKIQERLKKLAVVRVVSAPPIGSERPTSWAGHVAAIHKRYPLAGAITSTDPVDTGVMPPAVRLQDCDEEFLPEVREDQVRRTAEDISEVSRSLFRHSARVAIVDPYFNPFSAKCRESLKKFIEIARQERCEYLDIIAPDRWIDRKTAATELETQVSRVYGIGKKRPVLKFIFLPESSRRSDFHHRFLLSDFGAIRFDAGVAAESSDKWTDVILVARARHQELIEQYLVGAKNETDAYIWEWPRISAGYRLTPHSGIGFPPREVRVAERT